MPEIDVEGVRRLLAERVGRGSPGYVAGLATAAGHTLVTAGQSGGDRKLDGDSVFEVGSVTKVFTALLLADMAARGELALTDRVADHLPPDGAGSTAVTLLDLATHTAGLPRLPGNLRPRDPANPYADYTVAQLHAAWSAAAPATAPDLRYEYSNFGYGLLGHILARRAGQGYEALVVSRICDPLGLHDTRITLTPDMRRRLVPGHDAAMAPVPGWDMPALAGAGALRSTTHDLLRFLDACRGAWPTPLAPALARLLATRRPGDMPNVASALGWSVLDLFSDPVAWKNGGTYGCSSLVGYATRTGRAAVLLSNGFSLLSTTQIGLHLVDGRVPLPP